MKNWLCVGSKRVKPCIHAEQKVVTVWKPVSAMSNYTAKFEVLSIYCRKKGRYISKFVTCCDGFMNSTIEQCLNKKGASLSTEVKNKNGHGKNS